MTRKALAIGFCTLQAAAGLLGFAAALAMVAWGLPQARSAVFSAQGTLEQSRSLLSTSETLLSRVAVVLSEAERSAGAFSDALPGLRELSARSMDNAGYWKDYAARMAEATQGLSGAVEKAASVLPLKVPDGLSVEMGTVDVRVTKVHYPSGITPTFRMVLEKECASLTRASGKLSEIAGKLSESARLMGEVSGEKGKAILGLMDRSAQSLALARAELSVLNQESLPELARQIAGERRDVEKAASAAAGAGSLLVPAALVLAFLPLLFFGNALVMLHLLVRKAPA